MFKRIVCTGILVGTVVLAGQGIKESYERKGYSFGNEEVKTEESIDKVTYTEPNQDTMKALDEGLKENKERKDSEPSTSEKVAGGIKDYIDTPVGTESPFYVEDGEVGENPVYDGMSVEETQKPKRNDKYANSPFYNPETGENVVETGEKVQDNMSEEKAPFIR